MRTNHAGVTEKAEFKIDQDKYAEGWERVFGKKEECSEMREQDMKTEHAPMEEALKAQCSESINMKLMSAAEKILEENEKNPCKLKLYYKENN